MAVHIAVCLYEKVSFAPFTKTLNVNGIRLESANVSGWRIANQKPIIATNINWE